MSRMTCRTLEDSGSSGRFTAGLTDFEVEASMMRKSTYSVLLMLALFLAATGCGTTLQPTGARVPSPVTENGMTLDWGVDIKRQALDLINHSQQMCYLDIYELSDPDILTALIHARSRGVDVRVVMDAKEKHSQQTGLPTLKQAGVPVSSLAITHGISHIKMLLVDGQALIGGMNFGAGSWSNNDASVFLTRTTPSFLALFRWDWARAHGSVIATPSLKEPLIPERATEQHVIQAIQEARQQVAMEAFDLSDWGVKGALKSAARRGVQVEVLLDGGQAPNRKSAAELQAAGVITRFYRPYQNEWMHAKILDVDHGATFIIGSANFSHQAYTYNHEGDIELHGVPSFGKSLEDNLALQVARGSEYPVHKQRQYGT